MTTRRCRRALPPTLLPTPARRRRSSAATDAPPRAPARSSAARASARLTTAGRSRSTQRLQGGDVDPTLHNNNALYAGTPQSQALVAREGDPVPDAGAGVIYARSATASPFGTPLLNHAGQVGYFARLGGTGTDTTNSAALFVGAPGAVHMVTRAGDPTPISGMKGAVTRDVTRLIGTPKFLCARHTCGTIPVGPFRWRST